MEQIEETQNPPLVPDLSSTEQVIQPKSRKPFLIIVSLLLLLIIVTGAVYAGMKIQEKKQTPTPSSKITPSQTVPTAIPTTDQTVGWKTYTSKDYKLSFKYPNTWGIKGTNIPQGYLKEKGSFVTALGNVAVGDLNDDADVIEITSFDLTNSDQKKEFDLDLNTALKSENIKIGENSFIKYTGVNLNIAPDKYRRLDFWVIKSGNLGARIQVGSRVSGSSVKEDELRQILSTFKFIE